MINATQRLLPLTLAIGLAVGGSPALADTYCPPNPGPVTIDDNLIVNGPCVLDGTVIKGNVLVEGGGALTARDARVDGNIQADGANYVRVLRSQVSGAIQLEGLWGEESRIKHSDIGGNLQMDDNAAGLVAERNIIDGDLQAFQNRGGVLIRYNTIDGNLQCKANRPAPRGGFNQVSGNKEDQCARL